MMRLCHGTMHDVCAYVQTRPLPRAALDASPARGREDRTSGFSGTDKNERGNKKGKDRQIRTL